MRKKKIVITHAQVPFVRGGAELMVDSLIDQLKKHGFDVDKVQIPYKWYPASSLYNNLLNWRLLDLDEVNGEKIDLVISTKFPSYGVRHPNKVTWLVHQYRQVYDLYETKYGLSNDPEGNEIKRIVENYDKITLGESKRVYTISDTVTSRLKKNNNIAASTLYHPPSLYGRYKTGNYEDYILSVGRLDQLKRNDQIIKALKYCDKNIRLKIAGRGPELENLKKIASNYNVQDRVDFLGFVPDEDLIELYANAGAVYYAPVDEDYGYVTLEAFLSHKPVITCKDSGGVLEFVEHNVNGYISEPDEKALGEWTGRLFEKKNIMQQLGDSGYEKVKDISWDNVIEELTKDII